MDAATSRHRAVVVRPFRPADVALAQELRALAGWNQTERDWLGYLRFQPDGCFVAELDGRPVGTATTIRYGDQFGWIGMVLVHPDCRRLGVGRALLQHAIADLQAHGVRCVKLDATPMGRKVYVPLGFVAEYELARFEGTVAEPAAASASAPECVTAFGPEVLAEVVQLDAEIFGAARPIVLAELAARNPSLCFVAPEAGGVRGYLIAREGANAVQVGPWGARDPGTAAALFAALGRRVVGRRIHVDLLAPNVAGEALLRAHGLRVQRSLTRMFLGVNAFPGRPDLTYSISGAEKG